VKISKSVISYLYSDIWRK